MNIEIILNSLSLLSGVELEKAKRLIDNKIDAMTQSEENYMFHNYPDDFVYIIDYQDGTSFYECIGKKAYNKFNNEASSVRLRKKTKDLFPTYTTLLEKELHA